MDGSALWGTIAGGALVVAHLALVGAALFVIPGNRRPSTALAWLFLILAVPFLGVVAFALFGSNSVGRQRRRWQSAVNERVLAATSVDEKQEPRQPLRDEVAGLVRLNQRLGAFPLTEANTVEVVPEYAATLAGMCADVERAERFVNVEFYITAWDDDTDTFFQQLVAAAERGVAVRLLFDHLGSRGIPGYKDLTERLRSTKIQWATMLPVRPLRGELRRPDLRNHRKILVVDGAVAWTGSQNLVEPGYDKPGNHAKGRHWVDLMLRVTGPVVRQLDVVFATDWYAETREELTEALADPAVEPAPNRPGAVPDVRCQVLPSGPGFATENNLRLFNCMIYAARRRISLTSPYFVPDESLLSAVTTAAQRGVEVELFVSEAADQFMVAHAQRSYYAALLDAGVRIWLYPEPDVLHAKFLTVDDDLAVVGTSNMDYRSFALNYEVVVLCHDPGLVARLAEVEDHYRSLSRELLADEWASRPRRQGYVDNLLRLSAALQ